MRDLNSPQWEAAYKSYLNDIACTITSNISEEELEWLLSFAIRLEYGDKCEKYAKETSENVLKNQENVPKVVSANPLDNLDFESPEFINGVKTLANLLKVTQHPDHTVTLKAITKVVKSRLAPECLKNPNSVILKVGKKYFFFFSKMHLTVLIIKFFFLFSKGTPFPFQEADSGFDTGDSDLNEAAKILRLLYIHDLRNLQTQINETIVAVQSVTANPKTDSKLGQVGR